MSACAGAALGIAWPDTALAEAAPQRQALEDAWWTGPLLAPTAATLPKGHYLLEPIVADFRPYGAFDAQGRRHGVDRSDNVRGFVFSNYGVTDRFTLGAIPHFAFGKGGRAVRIGDLNVSGQYRLTQYREGSWTPTISVIASESLPLGRHDRLRGPEDGFGSGAYATMLGVYSQTYFHAPSGRLLRTRLNLTYTASNRARLEDASVYGTPEGFRGRARPGGALEADLAFEYSLTRNWVLATDLAYEESRSTRVSGAVTLPSTEGPITAPFSAESGFSRAYVVAPAIEYNFSPSVGVIVGARIVVGGRNVGATVTPAVGVNYLH